MSISDIQDALARVGPSSALFAETVDLLEGALREAEKIQADHPDVAQALPYVGLFWVYASGFKRMLPLGAGNPVLWNAPALAALARPMVEAYLAAYYFGIESVPSDERTLRELLQSRHAAYKELHLLQLADQENPEIVRAQGEAEAKVAGAQNKLISDPTFCALDEKSKKRLAESPKKFMVEAPADVWARSGLPRDQFNVIFRYLSQWVHVTPYAISQLPLHRAGTEAAAVKMTIPIGIGIACATNILNLFSRMARPLEERLPRAFTTFMEQEGHTALTAELRPMGGSAP